MKSKKILVLILSITLIFSITLILVSSGLGKPKPKPDPKPDLERITFVGDLYGNQTVEGCCGNAGPFPNYTMTLSEEFPDPMPGTHDGNIFMNVFMPSSKGAGKNKLYIVQFWWTEGNIEYFIEIIGGDIEQGRKAKILTVTFVDEPCEIWIDKDYSCTVPVSFILTREQL